MIKIEKIISEALGKAAKLIYNSEITKSQIQLQKTRKEFAVKTKPIKGLSSYYSDLYKTPKTKKTKV